MVSLRCASTLALNNGSTRLAEALSWSFIPLLVVCGASFKKACVRVIIESFINGV